MVYFSALVRNTGKEPKKLAYLNHVEGDSLVIRDAKGNPIPISLPTVDIKALLLWRYKLNLPPFASYNTEE